MAKPKEGRGIAKKNPWRWAPTPEGRPRAMRVTPGGKNQYIYDDEATAAIYGGTQPTDEVISSGDDLDIRTTFHGDMEVAQNALSRSGVPDDVVYGVLNDISTHGGGKPDPDDLETLTVSQMLEAGYSEDEATDVAQRVKERYQALIDYRAGENMTPHERAMRDTSEPVDVEPNVPVDEDANVGTRIDNAIRMLARNPMLSTTTGGDFDAGAQYLLQSMASATSDETLIDAVDVLDEAMERGDLGYGDLHNFAKEIISEHLADNPDSPAWGVIQTLENTYTRKAFVQKVSSQWEASPTPSGRQRAVRINPSTGRREYAYDEEAARVLGGVGGGGQEDPAAGGGSPEELAQYAMNDGLEAMMEDPISDDEPPQDDWEQTTQRIVDAALYNYPEVHPAIALYEMIQHSVKLDPELEELHGNVSGWFNVVQDMDELFNRILECYAEYLMNDTESGGWQVIQVAEEKQARELAMLEQQMALEAMEQQLMGMQLDDAEGQLDETMGDMGAPEGQQF